MRAKEGGGARKISKQEGLGKELGPQPGKAETAHRDLTGIFIPVPSLVSRDICALATVPHTPIPGLNSLSSPPAEQDVVGVYYVH